MKLLLAVALLGLAVPAPAALDATEAPEVGLLTSAQEQQDDACQREAKRASCSWRFKVGVLIDRDVRYDFMIPAFPTAVATVTVTLEGMDNGWEYDIQERVDGENRTAAWHVRPYRPEEPPLATLTRETAAHVLVTRPQAEYWLHFWAQGSTDNAFDYGGGRAYDGTSSTGDFSVLYESVAVPEGAPYTRAAATRDDPNLGGPEGDIPLGATDIVSAWFDDTRDGDGLIETHVALRNLSNDGLDTAGHLAWRLDFQIQGRDYLLQWVRGRGCADISCATPAPEPFQDCVIARGPSQEAYQLNPDPDLDDVITPYCTFDEDNSTLTAAFPTSALGEPGVGVRFERMRITSWLYRPNTPSATQQDRIEGERYAFALGGPAVWDELNPRLAVAPPAAEAWYVHPLAAENVPNTLQVGGALFAIAVFLGGLLLVRRRRTRVQGLLAEVDAIVRANRHDARRGLMLLGDLEESLDARLNSGKVKDAEYQIASQRIATAATRLAMRRDLGLDDGEPDLDPTIPGEPTR